jgi:hypothetical protein
VEAFSAELASRAAELQRQLSEAKAANRWAVSSHEEVLGEKLGR